MGRTVTITAALRVDPVTDTVVSSFGFDPASFTIITPGITYSIRYAADFQTSEADAVILNQEFFFINLQLQVTGQFIGTLEPGLTFFTINPSTGVPTAGTVPIIITVQNLFGGL